ncbi:MAG: mechanosensitive ion channel, partial [Methanosarcinales archaeon]|nr:mechanosensitive ion channel [Methanosarcinales archaeon]
LVYMNYFTDYFVNFGTELSKLLQSFLIILTAYLLNIIIATLIKRRIQDVKQRYSLRKTISTLISIATAGILITVWFRETTSLIVAYGIISAGIAIALQDLLKSVAGGVIIFISGSFKAGDRIQVGNEIGDVLDIKIFYTSLMEIREWIDGDQYSGRIIQLPNSFVLNSTVKNYTRDFSFIWDEIHLMFTFDSNWKKAQDITLKITREITDQFKTSAKNELIGLEDKYLITSADVEDTIYTQITDNWIDMRLRYVVDPRKRRNIKHSINEKLLEAFALEKDIEIASASFDIVGFPNLKIDK